MKKVAYTRSLVLSFILLVLGCGKDDSATTSEEGGPNIEGFSPNSGAVGTEVFITGKNFGGTAAANSVKIGNTVAPVTSASSTELFIKIPESATTGAISVTVGEKTDTGGRFTVIEEQGQLAIVLDKTSLDLYTNDTSTLVATVTGETASPITWSSDNPEVLQVDNQGGISALGSGSATVSAAVDNKTATCAITVNPNIYVTGYKEEGDMEVGELWINGIAQNLINASDVGTVFVNGMDVYVAGQDSNGEAVIWKNNEVSNLTSGVESAMAQSVFVLGNDVYAAGHNFDDSQNDVALVWKNDELLYELTDATTGARGYSIFVNGTDTYVAGYERTNSFKDVAKIWKNNNVLYELTDENNNGDVRSIFVSGTDVYAVGNEVSGNQYIAKIWKNGVATNLTDGSNYADSRSVFVIGMDVYVLVVEETDNGGTTKVLKNETLLYEITDESPVFALSLFVLDTDVYVTGFLEEKDNDGLIKSKVWKNNQVLYELEGSTHVRAYSVYVK